MIDYCIHGHAVYDPSSNKLTGNESSKRNCMVLNNFNLILLDTKYPS